jgi:DNA-binding MarR family transcriptional regulator
MAIDETIHQSLRLKIMAALYTHEGSETWEFARLKKLVEATDGNLGSHLTTLENAGYVTIEKDFVGKKPRTRVSITREGRRAFRDHVAYLRQIVDTVEAV